MKKRLLLLLALLTICSCTPLKAPTAQFQKYEITNISFNKADLAFLFDVENPNATPISIKDINYSLSLDGSNVVSGTHEGFSLQAKEKISVKIPIEIKFVQLVGEAGNLAKKFILRDNNIKYCLDGQASIFDNVGFSARVPFTADGEIKFF